MLIYFPPVLLLYQPVVLEMDISLSNNTGFNNFSIVNISRRENQVVQLNLSNQYYVELNLPVPQTILWCHENILSVIRLSDGKELWNPDNLGQVSYWIGR